MTINLSLDLLIDNQFRNLRLNLVNGQIESFSDLSQVNYFVRSYILNKSLFPDVLNHVSKFMSEKHIISHVVLDGGKGLLELHILSIQIVFNDILGLWNLLHEVLEI